MKTKYDQRLHGNIEMTRRVGVISLGCSKNLINSEQMMYLVSQAGYSVSGDTESADIVLLNTCGFIENAKAEAIETILELAAAKEDGKIRYLVVAGCLPQRYKDDILDELPEIDAVVGTGSFDDIVKVVETLYESGTDHDRSASCGQSAGLRVSKQNKYFGDIDAPVSETKRIVTTSPIWAYLKIAEGCNNRCAYCCIPDIRGKYRSRPIENIVNEAKKLVEGGTRELILVAQDVTGYGEDLYGKYRLADLLTELDNIDALEWIRLHYMYPDKIDDELIDVIAKGGKILKYLDIPIQHIDDGILRKMRRRSSGKDIRELFKLLRERIPGVVLRTSLITGLPGEGENEFKELYEFLKEAKIERAGVFAYSPEEGTEAARWGRPSKAVAESRAKQIRDLQAQIMTQWNESRVGSTVRVLIENPYMGSEEISHYPARSYAESPDVDGYIHVIAAGEFSANEKFADVRITGIENGELTGEIVKSS